MGPRSNLFSRRASAAVIHALGPLWGGAESEEIMRAGRAAETFPGLSGPTSLFPALYTHSLRLAGARAASRQQRDIPGINKAAAKHCKLTRLISSKAAERQAAYQLSAYTRAHTPKILNAVRLHTQVRGIRPRGFSANRVLRQKNTLISS